MENLLHPHINKKISERIDSLKPGTKALWGKMNINQALWHMAVFLDIPLDRINPAIAKKPPVPKWLLKYMILTLRPPKNIGAPFEELDAIGNNINPPDFEVEKNKLKTTIEKFVAANSFIPEHKIAGKFSRNDWGKLCYNHTDHHLRQFGV